MKKFTDTSWDRISELLSHLKSFYKGIYSDGTVVSLNVVRFYLTALVTKMASCATESIYLTYETVREV